ncbi:MAG: hypothetical protein NXI00_06130 [Cytophagales bacterium]|nr:hypothetical protein [Cytophagales bacterium]
MKQTSILRLATLVALLVLLTMGGCKKDPIDEPIEYNFEEEFGEVELMEVETEEPEATTTTEAETEEPEAVAIALEALANGEVTTELNTATTQVSNKLTEADVEATVNAFSEEVVQGLAKGEGLPSEAQNTVNAVLASGALDAFLTSVVDPTVDGESVSARKYSGQLTEQTHIYGATEIFLGVQDECTDAAQSAFDPAKAIIDAQKLSQEANATSIYEAREVLITNEFDAAIVASTLKWQGKIETRISQILLIIASIDASTTFDSSTKSLLKLVMYAKMSDDISKYNAQLSKQLKADELARDKKIAKAVAVRDKQLQAIQTNYNTELARIISIYEGLISSCHNQGGSS